jgi:hypothetical protein
LETTWDYHGEGLFQLPFHGYRSNTNATKTKISLMFISNDDGKNINHQRDLMVINFQEKSFYFKKCYVNEGMAIFFNAG